MKDHEHAHHPPASEPHAHAHGHASAAEEGRPRMLLALFLLTALSVAVMAFNQLQIVDVQYGMSRYSALAVAPAASDSQGGASGASLQSLAAKVMPKGIPVVYGSELGVSYDDPVKAMAVLGPMDDGNGMKDAAMNARYVKIGSMMACEYCCGATTLVFPNGQAACGCQHSYVMRGLAKYLIEKHGSEFTDEQILAELGKWKALFFPKPVLTKALAFESAGKDASNIVDLTSNKFQGFEKTATAQGPASSASSLPSQVGGC